ncbi:MAG: hypothetical protein CVU16_07090 [Betaproteobacteria bacterium HGW-Betaproteobacteria-10]|nr:MAG: hypothetical protein CVU16_07090 [Betaproteobacteria bacterium HGW-Betaproteobacteria-10]
MHLSKPLAQKGKEGLIYAVRPKPFTLAQDRFVEGKSPYFQGLRQAQSERFQIEQCFLRGVEGVCKGG